MSREFRERYRDVLEAVDELRPGFWTAMADELRRLLEGRVTTRGAVVREFPALVEAGVQAVVSTREVSTETITEAGREAAVQTQPADPEPDSTSTDEEGTPIEEPPGANPRGGSPSALDWPVPPTTAPPKNDPGWVGGCWNCGSRVHLARECPQEKRGEYCFRYAPARTAAQDGWLRDHTSGTEDTRGPIHREAAGHGAATVPDPTRRCRLTLFLFFLSLLSLIRANVIRFSLLSFFFVC